MNTIQQHCLSFLARLALTAAIVATISSQSDALTVSLTGGTSGGSPGGQPLYEVSGLVQGDSFDVDWGGVPGLSVAGTVTIASLDNTSADIRVELDNMNTPISGDDPRVTSIGFVIPDFSSIAGATTGGTFLSLQDDSNFPGFTTDFCGASGTNCAGGGSGGIPAAASDDLLLSVNGNFNGLLTLQNFALKIQGGPNGNSFELAGVPVPEPSGLLLLCAGLAGLLGQTRRVV